MCVYVTEYLNRPDVREALHLYKIQNHTRVLFPSPWTECSDRVFRQWPVSDSFADTTALYGEIHSRVAGDSRGQGGREKGWGDFRVLIYSGDADGVSLYYLYV